MTEKKGNCPICDKPLDGRGILHYLKIPSDPKKLGPYCSKKCAIADSWGPRFKKAKVVA